MPVMNIHAKDNQVTVDGDTRIVDLSALGFDPDVKHLGWDGTNGVLTFHPDKRSVRAAELGETAFTDFAPYQPILDAWAVAPAPPAPIPQASDARIQDIPADVGSVPALRDSVNQILSYLRGE